MSNVLRLAGLLGWQDLRQAYRRSALGPFWITAGMAVQISTMGLVFSLIFKANSDEYVPFLAVSVIVWGFLSLTITESSLSLINAEQVIKQLNISLYVHVFRTIWKNILAFGHNIVILPIVFLVFFPPINMGILLAVPAFLIVIINLGWLALVLAMLCARYRDMPPIINSVLTIAFYLTPVMWMPKLLPEGIAHLLLGLNPMYHLLQIIRLPLLGQFPTLENWVLSSALAAFGWIATWLIYSKFKSQIAYWV